MGRPIVHFEIGGTDIGETAKFYRELFDWDIGEEEMEGFRMIGTEPGSIGGGLMKTPEGLPPYVTIYVEVDDLQAALTRAEQLGGKTVVEPMPIPGFGAFAWFRDPGGAVVGLFEEPPATERATAEA